MDVMGDYVEQWDSAAPGELSARCGWCAHDVQMRRVGSTVELSRTDQARGTEIVHVAAPYVCTRYECHRLSLILMHLLHDRTSGRTQVAGIASIPQGQAQPMDGLPEDVQADRLEAWSCFHAGNFRAAIIMGRAAIQRGVRSLKAEAPGLKLTEELKSLRGRGIITEDVKSWGDEVRIAGDDAAHPSELTRIDRAEAQASLEFMDAFLEHAIALPARRKVKKDARQTGNEASAKSPDESA